MKTTQRGFIVPLLLIIAAILLAGGGAYFYTQTKSENPPVTENVALPQATSTAPASNSQTANWKTYINKEYGFSLEYPADWTIQDMSLKSLSPNPHCSDDIFIYAYGPVRNNLPGYVGSGIQYVARITTASITTGFGSVPHTSNQTGWDINISSAGEQVQPEYNTARQIQASLVLNTATNPPNCTW